MAVGIRFFDDAQRPEELRDKVLVWVWTVLFKSRGILLIDLSLPKPSGGIETARAFATGTGAKENGEAPRPFVAAAN